MKAHYHPNSTDSEQVEILDIFIDEDDHPMMMFLGANGRVATAPIGRFTELEDDTPPVRQQFRLHIIDRNATRGSGRAENHS